MSGAEESALEGLLSAIRTDIRRGDYARLETYSGELEVALAGVATLPRPALLRVLRAAKGTAACLVAARQGLQAGRRRLGEIGAASRGEAYDAKGRRHALEGRERRLPIGSNTPDFAVGGEERLNPRRV